MFMLYVLRNPRKPRHTRDFLINRIKYISKELGRVPRPSDLKKLGPTPSSVCFHFKTWNNLLIVASLLPPLKPKYTRDSLINKIKDIEAVLGRTPRTLDLNKFGVTISSTRSHFKNWNDLLIAADLKVNFFSPGIRPSNPEIKASFIALTKRLGYVPTMTQTREHTKELGCNVCTAATAFGGFNSLVRECGFKPKQPGAVVERIAQIIESAYLNLKREYRTMWLVNPLTGCKLPCDFFIPELRLFIEYDDESHFDVKFYVRKGTSLERAKQRFEERKYFDSLRNKKIPAHGFNLLRITYKDSLSRASILNRIQRYV